MEIYVAILVALITSVFGPALVTWIKHKLANKKANSLQEAIEHNEIVNQQLQQIFDKLECKHACIYQFHNGGNFYPTGKSIQKFSMFYEKVDDNTSSIQSVFQNIPVSLFTSFFTKIHIEGEIWLTNDKKLRTPISNHHSSNIYFVTLKNSSNQFVGMIGLVLEDNKQLKRDDYIFIREKVGVIGTLLTDYLNEK